MKMVDIMGIKPPLRWKDELFKNELMKLDVKRQLGKIGQHSNSRSTSVMTKNGKVLSFNFGSYFDRNLASNLHSL